MCVLNNRETERRIVTVNRGIIWDLDGVIVDSAPFHFQAWRALAAARGKAFTRENFGGVFGMRNEDILAHIFGR
jgi:beta-phosphoglucomutase